jgi:hypothetical protein
MDEFEYEFEENNYYVSEHLKELLKEIARKARVSIDKIEDDIFDYSYIDDLICSVISGCIQLSFYVLIRKIYEKRSKEISGGEIKNNLTL